MTNLFFELLDLFKYFIIKHFCNLLFCILYMTIYNNNYETV